MIGGGVFEWLLGSRGVCEGLGVGYTILYCWIISGRVKAVRIASGRYRIPESEVNRVIEEVEKE